MSDFDRDEYARRHAVWFGAGFGGVLLVGLIRDNTMAAVAGVLGLAWLARAFWRGRK